MRTRYPSTSLQRRKVEESSNSLAHSAPARHRTPSACSVLCLHQRAELVLEIRVTQSQQVFLDTGCYVIHRESRTCLSNGFLRSLSSSSLRTTRPPYVCAALVAVTPLASNHWTRSSSRDRTRAACLRCRPSDRETEAAAR